MSQVLYSLESLCAVIIIDINFSHTKINNSKISHFYDDELLTLLGSVPSFINVKGRVSVRPIKFFLNSSMVCPILFLIVGFCTQIRGRFPSPAISNTKDLPFVWPSNRASNCALNDYKRQTIIKPWVNIIILNEGFLKKLWSCTVDGILPKCIIWT